MVEIHLGIRWVEHDDMAHLLLISELLQEYFSVRPNIKTKVVAIGVARDLDHTGSAVEWQRFDLRIPRFDDWSSFSKWCKDQEIIVTVRKKMIDGNKDWWPVSIEVDAPPDNGRLFATKLRVF